MTDTAPQKAPELVLAHVERFGTLGAVLLLLWQLSEQSERLRDQVAQVQVELRSSSNALAALAGLPPRVDALERRVDSIRCDAPTPRSP